VESSSGSFGNDSIDFDHQDAEHIVEDEDGKDGSGSSSLGRAGFLSKQGATTLRQRLQMGACSCHQESADDAVCLVCLELLDASHVYSVGKTGH
jgi:hypothetical protein